MNTSSTALPPSFSCLILLPFLALGLMLAISIYGIYLHFKRYRKENKLMDTMTERYRQKDAPPEGGNVENIETKK